MSELRIKRPERWDQPFDPDMDVKQVARVLESEHFKDMEETAFSPHLSLRDIIQNDCRVKKLVENQLITYSGEYLNSAFVILSGSVTMISPPGIDSKYLGRKSVAKPTLIGSITKWLNNSSVPEYRQVVEQTQLVRSSHKDSKLIIKNLGQKIIDAGAQSQNLEVGDIFGESAVLGRNENIITVVANEEIEILEIRWQGLRDICKKEVEFKNYINQLYRERGLYNHLLTVPLFSHLDKEKIRELAQIALFEVHGEFEWFRDFKKASENVLTEQDLNQVIKSEPVIVKEGEYPDGLLLIRNGFSRISREINNGHYTIGYLSGGDMFGLNVLYQSWNNNQLVPNKCSLRALGYADIIRIPTAWLEVNIFIDFHLPVLQHALNENVLLEKTSLTDVNEKMVNRQFIEFLVEKRFINGTAAMVIDLERCVRCDDCVKACANGHDNNPRFIRQGQKFDRYMIANACMHCDDPVCMIGCPTGAIHRAENGVVKINDATCIGCSTCANSCPYNNIQMVEIRNNKGQLLNDLNSKPIVKASKCDLCAEVSGAPACQRACGHDALTRIDLKNLDQLSDWINR